MKFPFRYQIILAIAIEIAIFIVAYILSGSMEETFRYSARYSGRLSFITFLIAFYKFAFGHPLPIKNNLFLKRCIAIFCIVHCIHFGFLAVNVVLNDIPIVPVKLTGGFIAYLMIIIAPFVLHKLKLAFQLTYFYYVSIVMIITYIVRAKGDFKGVEPFWFHYLALGILISSCVFLGWKVYDVSKKN